MQSTGLSPADAEALANAFVRLAQADFTVRLPRNHTRDTADVLAYFVNLIAEELDRLLSDSESNRRTLADGVTALTELHLALAAGNFEARAPRTFAGDPLDVLAYMFNNTASEVGGAFREVEKQRNVLEATLESMIDGVLLLDAEGVVRRPNAAIARLLGYQPAELAGVPVVELLDEAERGFGLGLADVVARQALHSRETVFRHRSGERFSLAVNGSAHRDAAGSLVGIVLVARDERELKRVVAQLQIADRLAAIGTVAAGIGHEINNPLAYITGNLDFALEALAAPAGAAGRAELVDALRDARDGAHRVREIVGDLKALSRVDVETLAAVQLNELVDRSLSMLRNEISHHARIVKEYGTPPGVRANAAKLDQVILNLLQNAAQAIPEGHADQNQIRIVTGANAAGEAFLEVHDTGCGIAPENLHRIYDAFFTTKPAGVGTGLGLAICHKIVTSLDGRIEVDSVVGRGTSFRITLPRAPAPVVAAASAEAAAPPPARRRRVLVVDDQPEIGRVVKRALGAQHEVDAVTSGRAGLEALERNRYDVVLCDLMMPDMTGMELFERLVRERHPMAERMVFMTGGAFTPTARAFLDQVGHRTIEKPFERSALAALIAETAAAFDGRAETAA